MTVAEDVLFHGGYSNLTLEGLSDPEYWNDDLFISDFQQVKIFKMFSSEMIEDSLNWLEKDLIIMK